VPEPLIAEMAKTIKLHGIRQPLTVLRVGDEKIAFEVVSGERRLRAAKLLCLAKVPCIIIDDQEKAEEIAFKISQQIQTEMQYPGQVKVTVIREKRAVHYAK